MGSRKVCRQGRMGQATVETVVGLILVVPIFLALFDIILVYIGYNINLAAARDACRAAASAVPGNDEQDSDNLPDSSPLRQRAKSIVSSLEKKEADGGYIIGPTIEKVALEGFAKPANPDFGGAYKGTVSVETKVTIRLPVSIPAVIPDKVPLTTKSSFPLTANTASSVNVP